MEEGVSQRLRPDEPTVACRIRETHCEWPLCRRLRPSQCLAGNGSFHMMLALKRTGRIVPLVAVPRRGCDHLDRFALPPVQVGDRPHPSFLSRRSKLGETTQTLPRKGIGHGRIAVLKSLRL